MMSGHSNNRWRQLVFDKDGKRYADGSMRRLNMKFPSLQRLYLDVNSAWPGRWAIKASIPPAVFVVDPSNPAPPAQFSTPNATRSSQLNFPLIDENSFFEMCDESEKIVPTVLRASWTGTDQAWRVAPFNLSIWSLQVLGSQRWFLSPPSEVPSAGFRLNFFPRGRIANTSWGIIAPYSHPAIVNTSLRATIEHEMEHLSSAKEPSCSQTESGAALGDGTIKDARDETAHVIQPRLFTDSHPGDVLFIPGGWWYASVALSPTVAVEHKFSCSSANTAAVLAELKKRGQVEGAVRRCADAMRRATSQTRKKTQPRENLRENQGPIKSRNTRSNSAERPKHSSPRSQEPFSGASMSPGTGNAFSETDFADEMKSRGMQQMKIGDDLLWVATNYVAADEVKSRNQKAQRQSKPPHAGQASSKTKNGKANKPTRAKPRQGKNAK
eukprot:INCI18799.1.p1 GENE.INCI18799.1~~INCI18799.1.p1  ORF type:complete len:440 (+),score=39.57 INCI18799.1:42-1361(+)